MTIRTWRTGSAGGGYWSQEGRGKISCEDWPREFIRDELRRGLMVEFQMSSAGRGSTKAVVGLESDSFEELAIAMVRADAKAAVRAFGAALKIAAESEFSDG